MILVAAVALFFWNKREKSSSDEPAVATVNTEALEEVKATPAEAANEEEKPPSVFSRLAQSLTQKKSETKEKAEPYRIKYDLGSSYEEITLIPWSERLDPEKYPSRISLYSVGPVANSLRELSSEYDLDVDIPVHTIADVRVDEPMMWFLDEKLVIVTWYGNRDDVAEIAHQLTLKFGDPSKTGVEEKTNSYGATFNNEILYWENDVSFIRLQSLYTLEQFSLSFGLTNESAELNKKLKKPLSDDF